MANDLSPAEKDQLTKGGLCNIHEHEVNLTGHRHIDSLQALEVVTNVYGNHVVSYREDIIVVDTSAGNVTITLPKSRGGKVFQLVKATAANSLSIVFSSGQTMLGVTSITLTDFGSTRRLKSVPTGYIPL